jgi:FtsH-binding integral membrane protein
MYSDSIISPTHRSTLQSFMAGIYSWMSCALAITAAVAYYVAAHSEFLLYIQTHPLMLIVLFVAQLGLVIALSALIYRMSFVTALALFVVYAALMGLTLSTIFALYTTASIVTTFITTAGMFGAMALYGYFTKTDLTTIGSLSIMMLFGLIIGMFVNIFMQNQTFDFILSGIGVIVFTLLTAYDVQKLKLLGQQLHGQDEMTNKITLLGALTLYLDFINLFLFMLRFMGNRRES